MSQGSPSGFKKLFGKKIDEEKVEEEILSMVEEGHEHGIIEETEAEMINNIFEFSDKEAKEIMTSRQKIIALENTLKVGEALEQILDERFSRYPVYEDDIDSIVGVIHIKDLMSAYMKAPDTCIDAIIEKPIFVHPTYNISKLLQKMQREKMHMSVVLDEYGQTEGIITMEDIIEEIVGNIFDEHDEEDVPIRVLSDGSYMVDGGVNLDELKDTLCIEFPDEDFETLNGFLLYELGRFPKEGEDNHVVFEGYSFNPIRMAEKMISLVEIQKINQENNTDKE